MTLTRKHFLTTQRVTCRSPLGVMAAAGLLMSMQLFVQSGDALPASAAKPPGAVTTSLPQVLGAASGTTTLEPERNARFLPELPHLQRSVQKSSSLRGSVLIFGLGDETTGSADDVANLQRYLTDAGYNVTVAGSGSLPGSLSDYQMVWYLDATASISSTDQQSLVSFVRSGGGLYLTGERPCCESMNTGDQAIVNALLPSGGVTIGGLGDKGNSNSINDGVIDGIATTPNVLSTWTPSAPGGINGVRPANVLAMDSTGAVTGAAWESGQMNGSGRLAILMDVNWLQSSYQDPVTAPQIVQNLAWFLTKGKVTPPLPTYVAIGDSYSSGEGLVDTPQFIPPSNEDGCHRATSAWPALAAKKAKYSGKSGALRFVACSGAPTGETGVNARAFVDDPNSSCSGSIVAGRCGERSQLSSLSLATKAVTISAGGNDAGFATIARDCLQVVAKAIKVQVVVTDPPPDCANDLDRAITMLVGPQSPMEQSLEALYSAVLQRAPNAQVEVVNYPQIFTMSNPQDFCPVTGGLTYAPVTFYLGYNHDSISFMNTVESKLNGAISQAVQALSSTGRISLVDLNGKLTSSAIPCDTKKMGKAGINGLLVSGSSLLDTIAQNVHCNVSWFSLKCSVQQGFSLVTAVTGAVSKASLHPKKSLQQPIADAVLQYMPVAN